MRKYCKALVNLGVAFIILTLIVFLVPKLLVFFAPFVAGWIIALIASPLVRFFEEKVKIKRKAGSAFVIVAVIALVILILYLVGAKLVDEIMGLIGALPDIWDSAENDFADIGQNLSVIYNRFRRMYSKASWMSSIRSEAMWEIFWVRSAPLRSMPWAISPSRFLRS